MEVAHITAGLALHTLDKPGSSEYTSSTSAILRCWNREQVRQIRKDTPETVMIRIPPPGLPGEPLIDINKALLSRLSTYYKAIFHSGFSESTQKIFDMDICAEDMHAFRTWLRDGRLTFRWDRLSLEQFVRLYVFADYYDIPALRRTIMTALVLDKYGNAAQYRLLTDKIGDYLSQLPPTSPLFQWLGMVWARHLDAYHYSAHQYQLANEMPEDLRRLVYSIRSQPRASRPCKCCYRPCDFHEHESEQEWESTCRTHENFTTKPDPSAYRKSFEIP